LIHQDEVHEFVYDEIIAGNWRDTAKKKALYAAIAAQLAESPGLRTEDVQVVLSSNERDEWSFGNGIASYVNDARCAAGAWAFPPTAPAVAGAS
jgi:phenylpyruvate tautomerase PptA (4-oxalocrotonate tautomerase family)